jgi:hypothetical protein
VVLQLRFAMFSTRLLQDVGPAECQIVNATIMVTKERVNSVPTLMGWVRSKDPMHCPIGALAMYMVFNIDNSGLPLLSYIEEDLISLLRHGPKNYDPRWRRIYLLHGKDPFSSLPPNTHNKDIKRALAAGEEWEGYCGPNSAQLKMVYGN